MITADLPRVYSRSNKQSRSRKHPMDKHAKPPKPTMTLGDMRRLQAMSMSELAEKAGVTVSSVSRIEAGSVPRYGTLRALAAALGVKPEEIRWPGDPLGINGDSYPTAQA